jgi:hypothetical protein
VRLVQRRFAADSLRSIVKAVEGGGSDRVVGNAEELSRQTF